MTSISPPRGPVSMRRVPSPKQVQPPVFLGVALSGSQRASPNRAIAGTSRAGSGGRTLSGAAFAPTVHSTNTLGSLAGQRSPTRSSCARTPMSTVPAHSPTMAIGQPLLRQGHSAMDLGPDQVHSPIMAIGQPLLHQGHSAMDLGPDQVEVQVSVSTPRTTPRTFTNVDLSEEPMVREAKNIFGRIVKDGSDSMSRLQLINALTQDATVASFMLPGHPKESLLESDEGFEAAHHLFNDIARGRKRVVLKVFLAHFQHTKVSASNAAELREIFDAMDVNQNNTISRYELLNAVKRDESLAALILRDVDTKECIEDEESQSDAVDRVFKSIAGDWNSFDFADFVAYFRGVSSVANAYPGPIEREQVRVLIIGPGFDTNINPQMVTQAGFKITWVHDVPNPEEAEHMMLPHVSRIRGLIQQVQPDLLVAASKGGAYAVALWQMGYWRGPTVLINAHPTCGALPPDVPIVIAHGDQDPIYPCSREELEALASTGTRNKCFLYYAASAGPLPSGQLPRVGDHHNMASLCQFDTLPRLMDSAVCPEGPELHMIRTWRDRLLPKRLDAEAVIGHTPQRFRHFWINREWEHMHVTHDNKFLFDVTRESAEFQAVSTVFTTSAKDPSSYGFNAQQWERCQVCRIQRVENAAQEEGGTRPYYDTVKRSFARMGIEFVPGVHTRWLFHGSSAVDSIVSNPVQGFQPLASGSAGASVWGRGTYFARDAGYVASGPFCGQPATDGTRRMLMCLVTTGMSCIGSPHQTGILPVRQGPYRYNSSVDSLSSPEIFIIQHPGAAYPAYLITFRG